MSFGADLAVRLGYHLLKWGGDDISPRTTGRVRKILDHVVRLHRRRLLAPIIEKTARTVTDGPFFGLRFSDAACRQDPFIGAKLLGYYEREIQDLLAGWTDKTIDGIVNVGSGNGFFSMGSAKVLKPDTVWAVDICPATLAACEENFRLNGMTEGAHFLSAMNGAELAVLARDNDNLLIISDCEGFELELFTADTVPAMSRAHLIIECHDFVDSTITQTMTDLFTPTHDIAFVTEGPRDPHASDVLRPLPTRDKWLVISEDRPETMHWLIATPKTV